MKMHEQIIPQLLTITEIQFPRSHMRFAIPLLLFALLALQVMEKQNPELKDIPHWSQVMGDVDFLIQLLKKLYPFATAAMNCIILSSL